MENRFMELERGIRSILSGIAWEKVENEMKDIRGGVHASGFHLVSHYTGKDFFAVADLCGNIKSEWSTLTQAKEHKTSESEKIIAVDCIQVWSVHDAEGRNVTGLWYPYESRALAVLYKKVNPKYWTEFVSKELQDIAEEKIDFFNYNSFKIYDRLKPIYDAASIVNFNISCMTSTQKAGKSLNELIDLSMSYTNVVDFCVMCCKDDLELLPLMKQAVVECYKLRFDTSNQISTLRVNRYPDIEGTKESYIPINKYGERIGVEVYDSESQAVNVEGCKYVYRLDSGFHYKVVDTEGNIIGRDIYEDELEALVFLYKRSNPTSWTSYYSSKYKEI